MYVQNLKFVALLFPDIIGSTQKLWAVPGYAPAPFLQNFEWAFVRMCPMNVQAICLKSVTLPDPEIIAIEVLGGGCEPPILGKRRP